MNESYHTDDTVSLCKESNKNQSLTFCVCRLGKIMRSKVEWRHLIGQFRQSSSCLQDRQVVQLNIYFIRIYMETTSDFLTLPGNSIGWNRWQAIGNPLCRQFCLSFLTCSSYIRQSNYCGRSRIFFVYFGLSFSSQIVHSN